MIRYIVLTISMVLITASAYALDVSVVNDRAQAGVTINSLVSKVDLLSAAVKTQSDLLNDASVKITKMQFCASVDMIYDEASITNANLSGCVSPPIDPTQLASVLTCEEGEVIKMVDGSLSCSKDTLEQCQICEDYKKFVQIDELTGNACWIMGGKDEPSTPPTMKTVVHPERLAGSFLKPDNKIVDTICYDVSKNGLSILGGEYVGTQTAITVTYSGSHHSGYCGKADIIARDTYKFPIISKKKELNKKYREHNYTKPAKQRLVCK